MRIFGLIILKAKDYDRRNKEANMVIANLAAEKQRLITYCDKLLECNKSRQLGRALARRQQKIENLRRNSPQRTQIPQRRNTE